MAAVLALTVLLALGGSLAYLDLRKRLNLLLLADQIVAQQREAEAEERRQRRSPEHKVSPPSRGPTGLWQGACSCGWKSPGFGNSSDVLDAMEAHKAEMRLRRAG